MDRKYNLKLDLQFKCNNSTMKFNQFDNNTSDFFMRITNAGKLVDIEKAIVVLAAIKPSGKVSSQFVEVENGLVYADLKNSMKDEIGTYTAQAMLILEDERVVTDPINYEVEEDKIFSLLNDTVEATEDFTLLTDMLNRLSVIEISEEQRQINESERILSEENRKIEEAKRVETELIRQHEEADRSKYDATRESNENIRKQNESIRLSNETNRIDEEAKRVEEENKRKLAEEERKANYNFMTEDEERRRSEANAHKEAEILRVQAETNRVNEEAKRRTTEQARVSAENTRVSNENTRKANEETRQSNETQRVEAETQRQSRYNSFITDAEANANNFENYTNNAKVKEEERKANELDRKTQEDRRVSNEVERISNENTRKANEVVREKNETSRQNVFENKVNEVDEKIVELNTTKDNFISSVNTKVDTKISELNTTKDNFVSSINTKVDNKISEIEVAKSDMTTTVSNKVNEVETRFNRLTSSQQQSSEVIDARDGETSLKARLDRDIEKAKQVYVNVEGNHISTDSSSGYLKDVEILGNTIQDASNLADIRSVGDKVEGQELYEIPVVSCGKNLFNLSMGYREYVVNNTTGGKVTFRQSEAGNQSIVKYVKCKKNDVFTFSCGKGNLDRCFIYELDSNDIVVNIQNIIGTTKTIQHQDTVKCIVYLGQDPNNVIDFNTVQIEEGTVATPYEPYVEDKLTILSPVQLERVGDVADRIIEKDGVWGVEKNIYTNNNFKQDTTKKQLWKLDSTIEPAWIPKDIWNKISYQIMCSHYTEVSTYNELLETEGIFIDHKNATPNIIISTNDVNVSSLPSDLIVKYQLATPQFIPLPHDQQVKLRTFANKTNISFLTEIEGTIKAQVPKSLGATVNTHTEQISNLNKELDRVKKLEESTVSTVETESDFITVEVTSNGYFEDVKLEGKTLVNLCRNLSAMDRGYSYDNQTKILQTSSNGVDDTPWTNVKSLFDVIDGKEYTFVYNALDENTTIQIRNNIDREISVQSATIGINILKIKAKGSGFLFKFYDKNRKTQKRISHIMLLEGDHTQNPPSYFEGLKSVGDGTDGILVESVNSDSTQSDKKPLLYYNNETQTWEKPILRQWDSIEKHADGKYYYHQRSGEVVLNGSEDWNASDSSRENHFRAYLNKKWYKQHTRTINDKLPNQLENIQHRDVEGIYITNTFDIQILNSKLSSVDTNGLKQWLQANNVTAVYQLAKEKVYECTNIDLITYANETNYIVECGAIVPKSTLKVHNNISNVVNLLQKKVSLLESNITSYMITQNRLMLASRYNADTVSFKVDVATLRNSFEYDNDLYELILNNILVGKDNYNREYIENLIIFYWMDFVISDEMYSTLFEIIEEQHNPKVIEEETPLI